jgi:hypothetical protein
MQPADHREGRAGDAQANTLLLEVGLPDLSDIQLAQQAIRVHCAMSWPHGLLCNNCHAPFPCQVHQWGRDVLEHAGWNDEHITALDQRTGPWS